DSPFNFAPPTDDKPFFFNMVKLDRIIMLQSMHDVDQNWQAVAILLSAMILAVYGSFLLAWLPLRIAKEKPDLLDVQLGIYFFSIGLGFMFFEISQIQRLIVFLGHPTYGLTCVLFMLLISSGAGSLCSGYLAPTESRRRTLMISLLVSLL